MLKSRLQELQVKRRTRGSMHGEVGQTQFMRENIPACGTGNLTWRRTR
jgi:membrane-bound lytic murein transglycosylase B